MPEGLRLPFTEDEIRTPFTLHARCDTDGNDPSGRRKDCDSSPPDEINAPEGFVLDDRDYEEAHSYRGSDPDVHLTWENYVELIPGTGIKYPTKASLWVHSRSPRGHNGQSGYNDYTIKGTMINVKKTLANVDAALKVYVHS